MFVREVVMRKIGDIDKNLQVKTGLKLEDNVFYDCLQEPFEINGLFLPKNEEDSFHRIPREVAENVSEGVSILNICTAGGRVRFKTNSEYVALQAILVNACKMPHMTFTGSLGFDLYEWRDGKEFYVKSFIPPVDIIDTYETVIELGEPKERELIINFPLYTGVKKLYIGLSKRAIVKKAHQYTHPIPVVYYGSSITQGGCASRPGNTYQSMITRRFDCDHVNLGFSGNAKGEPHMADYISKLTMSAFVYDYDYNAPDLEHLEKTHKPMFDTIRCAHPNLPIIIVSRPDYLGGPATDASFNVIKKTYESALEAGDRNVYLIDGRTIMAGTARDSGTVDGCHPNDLGFYAMAEVIGDVLAESLLCERGED